MKPVCEHAVYEHSNRHKKVTAKRKEGENNYEMKGKVENYVQIYQNTRGFFYKKPSEGCSSKTFLFLPDF